ncbi:spore germination protein (plasmid) [Bacillus sp. FDAARGOS_1420]|nr:spore germination protein [Bacillus sp. FDAARGOS_1420]
MLFFKILRIIAFFLALILPAAYIALISFNFSLRPVPLFLSIAESRENVPFSAIVEAMIMEITLEMMREAALRLPAPIGQTMGIVGGIIIGQAAVQAGIVSNIMIIIVSITGIASFTVPNYDMSLAVRYLRFPMMPVSHLVWSCRYYYRSYDITSTYVKYSFYRYPIWCFHFYP